jgi:hypothetical protein
LVLLKVAEAEEMLKTMSKTGSEEGGGRGVNVGVGTAVAVELVCTEILDCAAVVVD